MVVKEACLINGLISVSPHAVHADAGTSTSNIAAERGPWRATGRDEYARGVALSRGIATPGPDHLVQQSRVAWRFSEEFGKKREFGPTSGFGPADSLRDDIRMMLPWNRSECLVPEVPRLWTGGLCVRCAETFLDTVMEIRNSRSAGHTAARLRSDIRGKGGIRTPEPA
jgi:hypothetical protein